MDIDTLLCARFIIPVEPAGTVLHDHALAIDAGRIAAILPRSEALVRFRPRQCHELSAHALIPGLVNAHTHAAMTLFRGFADDRPLAEWLNEHIWPAERTWVNAAFVRDGARLAAAEMLLSGTTCFNDMYFFPDVTAEVALEAGIRATVGLIVIDFPSAWAGSIDEYFARGTAVHDRFRDASTVHTCFAPHAPYTVSDSTLLKIRTLAEELDIPITMHVHETAAEVTQALAGGGETPLRRLDRLGLLSPRLLAVHVTQAGEADTALLARHGVSVVHCPESNLKLASGLCPVQRLLDAGVNVALGTDGAASNNDLDMLGEMRTAALLGKAVAGDPTAVPAATALAMATLYGARALGLEERIGSLFPGKDADVVAVRLDGLHHQPLYDPLSQLVYTTSRTDVEHVWVGGRQVVEQRRTLYLDGDDLRARAGDWRDRIAGAAID
ncbi:MAG: TRZ/ATZ family hydrolase [Gammaproteobacteria bacterium]|nr:TRZ/ATZ family hydrolase [Gammaproteobacteria bacterium]